MLLDAQERSTERVQRYFEDFKAMVAVKTDEPFKNLAELLKPPEPEIEPFDEDALPPPADDEIDDIQAWLESRSTGTVSGSDLEGWL